MNIEGKRSGNGFVAHKEQLVGALSKAQASMVEIDNTILGRKGFLSYLKALGGSNVVKVVPSNGSASGVQATEKGLKVVCGANTSYLPNEAWVTEKNCYGGFCQVRISPHNAVKPNLGGIELAEVNLDFEDGEGEALIEAIELKGLIPALKRAKRVKVGFENGGERLDSKSLVIDTEAIRYKWPSQDGNYPDYRKVIPTDFVAGARFDTKEMLRACQSLSALWLDKKSPIKLTLADGKVILEAKEDRGKAEIQAKTSGEAGVGVKAKCLAQALKSLGGMAELKVKDGKSAMLFSVDGYQLVVMPMVIPESKMVTEAEEESRRAYSCSLKRLSPERAELVIGLRKGWKQEGNYAQNGDEMRCNN